MGCVNTISLQTGQIRTADEFTYPTRTIEPKWQVAQRLVKEIQAAVEKEHLTPLDGARTISAVAATLFGYDEFILREISPETLLATAPSRR